MIAIDENALICDLAETYNVFDYRKMPVHLIATLASGLRADSRIKMALNGIEISTDMLLMTTIVDQLNLLIWMQTKDGQKGRNRPTPVLGEHTKERNVLAFKNAEEFEEAKRKIIRKEVED